MIHAASSTVASNGLPASWGGGKVGLGSVRTYVPPTPPKLAAHLRPPPSGQELQARKAARTLVAQTFYGPMLKQMRDSPFKDEIFSGGRGGEAFSSLLDQQLTARMGRGNDPLVNAIVKRAMQVAGGRSDGGLRAGDGTGLEVLT